MRRQSRRISAAPRRKRRRFAALALGTGVALVLIAALVFSIAFGTRGIAQHADALHDADEALRAATVARSQAGLASHLSLLQVEFGFDAGDGIELAVNDTQRALTDLTASLDGLVDSAGVGDEALASGALLGDVSTRILEALGNGDVDAARQITATELDSAFREFVGLIVVVRDDAAAAVAASNNVMGRVGDITRFLVAFLVPTAVILIYRELSKRQQQQTELEVRLDAERNLGKARDEFVANASHELRTPLTSIFGLAHLLEEDEKVAESETAPEMVGLIISETHDLSRMVDDLLTTARLDAGALHYQFEDIPVLEQVHEVVEPMKRAGTAVAVDCHPALVRSDRLRLRQVIRNLLSNAGKYGGPNIRLVGRLVAGWYEVRVEDDGDGIPEELRARLFQRYLHQGDLPLVLGSVGLGLSIVRALAEGMGGAVWYERNDRWTAFVVRIPLAAQQATVEAPRYREPSQQRAATPGGLTADPPRVVDEERPDVVQPVPVSAPAVDAALLLPAPPPFAPPPPAPVAAPQPAEPRVERSDGNFADLAYRTFRDH